MHTPGHLHALSTPYIPSEVVPHISQTSLVSRSSSHPQPPPTSIHPNSVSAPLLSPLSIQLHPLASSIFSPLSAYPTTAAAPPLPPLRTLPPALPSFKPSFHHTRASRSTTFSHSSLTRLTLPSGPSPQPRAYTASSRMAPTPAPTRRRRGRRTAANSNLQCGVCHQFYSRRDNLRVHQRVHTGERPFSCRYCMQPFRWQGALRNHEGIHIRNGENPISDISRAVPRAVPQFAYTTPSHGGAGGAGGVDGAPAERVEMVPGEADSRETHSEMALSAGANVGSESLPLPLPLPALYTTSQGTGYWADTVLDDLNPRDRSRE